MVYKDGGDIKLEELRVQLAYLVWNLSEWNVLGSSCFLFFIMVFFLLFRSAFVSAFSASSFTKQIHILAQTFE